MRKYWLIISGFLPVFFAASCRHEPLPEKKPPVVNIIPEPVNPCDKDTVYFTNQILPLIRSNCARSGCHGDGSAQKGVDLTSYTRIIQTGKIKPFDLNGSDLYEVITENDPKKLMPPSPSNPLTADQIALIGRWINQGALNNGCNDCDTATVTFKNHVSNIIKNNCQGCHSGAAPNGGIRLTNHSEISAVALNGALYGAVSHQQPYTPMPYNQPKLSSCKIDQIRIWIAGGAKDN